MFKSFGVPEIILILAIILIFFGVGKLPQVGEAMGKAIHSFRKGQVDEEEEAGTPKKSSAKKVTKTKKTT